MLFIFSFILGFIFFILVLTLLSKKIPLPVSSESMTTWHHFNLLFHWILLLLQIRKFLHHITYPPFTLNMLLVASKDISNIARSIFFDINHIPLFNISMNRRKNFMLKGARVSRLPEEHCSEVKTESWRSLHLHGCKMKQCFKSLIHENICYKLHIMCLSLKGCADKLKTFLKDHMIYLLAAGMGIVLAGADVILDPIDHVLCCASISMSSINKFFEGK